MLKTDYNDFYPDEFLREAKTNPIAYLPVGSLEWHSYHLPLGFDSYAVEYYFRRLSNIKKGVVFPTIYYGIAENMPHPASMVIEDNIFKKLIESVLKGIIGLGFKVIIVSTGHWSMNQIIFIINICKKLMKEYYSVLIAGLPLGFVCKDDGINIDHAGKYETSLGLALFPDKVNIKRLGSKFSGEWKFPDIEQLAEFGIEGNEDPRETANKEYGEKILNSLDSRYSELIDEMLDSKTNKLNYYYNELLKLKKSNFDFLYKGIDPTNFYREVKSLISKKKYY